MSEKMPEGTKAVIVNISIVAGLVLCYFRGYSPKIIFGCGIVLLLLANALMYLKHGQISN
jgi:hypothetical protein